MGFKELFFPEIAAAQHAKDLKNLSRKMARSRVRDRKSSKKGSEMMEGIEEIEEDLGFLALVLMSLVNELVDNGVIDRDDIKKNLKKLDKLDGVEDGELDLNLVRGAMDMSRKEEEEEEEKKKGPGIRRGK